MLYGLAETRKMTPAINVQISIREVPFRMTDGTQAILIDAFVRFPSSLQQIRKLYLNPYPTAFPYGKGMVLHFYQQQESSTTKTVHKVINKGLKAYV